VSLNRWDWLRLRDRVHKAISETEWVVDHGDRRRLVLALHELDEAVNEVKVAAIEEILSPDRKEDDPLWRS